MVLETEAASAATEHMDYKTRTTSSSGSFFTAGSILLYGALLLLVTLKIGSMPIHSYDPYFYSYLASGEEVATFERTPGLPPEWVTMPEANVLYSRGFFVVKPLYVALTRFAIPHAGLLGAPFLVSTVAYFCAGWITWFWLRDLGVGAGWRTVSASLLMFSSVFTTTAREGTPDMLCTALLVCGAWLLLSTGLTNLGAASLLLAVFGRTDSLVFGGLLLLVAVWRQKISVLAFGIWSAALLICEFLVARQGYPYRQFVLGSLGTSYLHGLTHNFAKTGLAIYTPFILLAAMAIKMRYQTGLVVVCLVSWVVRYILLPHLEPRYLLAQAAIIGIVAAAAVFRTVSPTLPARRPLRSL